MKARLSLLLLSVALAGCTSAPPEPQVASAAKPNGSPVAASPSPAAQTDYDKALAYTRCMTDNGAPTPDPQERDEAECMLPSHGVGVDRDRQPGHDPQVACPETSAGLWLRRRCVRGHAATAFGCACARSARSDGSKMTTAVSRGRRADSVRSRAVERRAHSARRGERRRASPAGRRAACRSRGSVHARRREVEARARSRARASRHDVVPEPGFGVGRRKSGRTDTVCG